MYLAVDIGGTITLIALFSRHGRVIRRRKFKTAQGKERFFRELQANLKDFARPSIKAVAVAIPGYIKFDTSEQKICSVRLGNRDWGWFDITTPIKKLFSCPIYFENDANLAAIYESKGIVGKTVFLTFSTGIGGGLAENGQLIEAPDFEPGHVQYWYDGKIKEWEDIASSSALEKVYHVNYATDLRKKAIMQDVARRVYLGLPDIAKKYHPDTMILGGPLGKIFRLYVKYLPDDLGVKYRRPKRPNESVIYGCYLFARQARQQERKVQKERKDRRGRKGRK